MRLSHQPHHAWKSASVVATSSTCRYARKLRYGGVGAWRVSTKHDTASHRGPYLPKKSNSSNRSRQLPVPISTAMAT